tara:strand:- start:132227 stop:133405 length:1179 start_codon:yes stop_codon:yes gene_type:complete
MMMEQPHVNAGTVKHAPTSPASSGAKIAVMVVDDSLVIRGLIARMLGGLDGIEVVAAAGDGEQALKRLGSMNIDVVILDIEMPVMDGLTALPKMLAMKPDLKVIMASTLTGPNAEASLKALSLGAVDYIPKPTASRDISGVGGSDDFRRELVAKVEAVGRPRVVARAVKGSATASGSTAAPKSFVIGDYKLRPRPKMARRAKILAVGSSTGGPNALMTFFSQLPKDLGVPIILTQHMPPKFTTMLAKHITEKTGFPCVEATDGMPLVRNRIVLAAGDYHMLITGNELAPKVKLTQDPPENFCRPAVDPMLRSLIPIYGSRILTVILTGMGADGHKGSHDIVEAGGEILAQDPESSVVWGMPGAVARAGLCTAVEPLESIAGITASRILEALP